MCGGPDFAAIYGELSETFGSGRIYEPYDLEGTVQDLVRITWAELSEKDYYGDANDDFWELSLQQKIKNIIDVAIVALDRPDEILVIIVRLQQVLFKISQGVGEIDET